MFLLMKKLLAIVVLSLLWCQAGYTFDLPEVDLGIQLKKTEFTESHWSLKAYEGLKPTANKQFEYARSLESQKNIAINYRKLAIFAYKDFIDTYPEDKRVAEAIYKYGFLSNSFSSAGLLADPRVSNIIFKTVFENFPKSSYASLSYEDYLGNLSQIAGEYSSLYKATKLEKDAARKELCDAFLNNDPFIKQVIKKSILKSKYTKSFYEETKCSQIHGGIKQNISTPKNSTQTQTGFIIDLIESNNEMKETFNENKIIFDFKNFKVENIFSFKNNNGKDNPKFTRTYDILNVSDSNIKMQETVGKILDFCFSTVGEAVHPINGIITDSQKQRINIFSICKANYTELYTTGLYKDASIHGTSANTPYVYLNFNLKDYTLTKTYWPLRSNSTKSQKSIKKLSKNTNLRKITEFVFFAATAYLIISQIGTISKIAKGSGSGSKITSKVSGKAASSSSSTGFAGRSIGQKYKILKYYGYIR